ncbi:Bug family tripartite tricarboxylate transporter substrate binding protein [Pseudorhodoferax sp.]|uniref:Bug family tripartite tricarboxylate transporter substrate binding protein n=1 Tax=Pseudorhodoferax sp. TaxID=1993553 RepID=UPI002DD6667E|nr:tripartite tricarboxylate transporter substrate binding protein [Pseudorhodoferax sp.]
MQRIVRWMAAALALAACGAVLAQDWPARPLKLVVPFAPGGSTDVLGRLVALKLGEALGQPVVVENKPGAAGNLGTEQVVRAAPDGYTLVLGGGSNAVNANLYKNLGFDFVRDLTGVALIGISPNIMVVPPGLPVKSAAEFVDYAKQHRGGMNYASSGNGATTHLAAELFKSVTGVEMTHVPYAGSNPALTALMASQVQVMFDSIISATPLVKGGKLKALAVTSAQRNGALPEVPSLKELGIDVVAVSYFGIYAPEKTPAPVVQRLSTELRRIMKMAEVQERLASFGVQPQDLDTAAFNAFTREQIAGWALPVKLSGARID